MSEIQVLPYTEKSCVVVGPTYPYLQEFRSLGGKWNKNLAKLPDGMGTQGWIYPISKQEEVERLVSQILLRNQVSTGDSVGLPDLRVPTPKVKVKNPIGSISNQITSEGDLISYQKKPEQFEENGKKVAMVTETKVEELIKDGKKILVTTTHIVRTEEIIEESEAEKKE